MIVGPHLALLVLHNLETLDQAAAAHVAHTREPGQGDIEKCFKKFHPKVRNLGEGPY